MVKRTVTTGGVIYLIDDTGETRVERIKSGVLLVTFAGNDSTDVDAKMLEELDQELARNGRVTAYLDAKTISRLAENTKGLAVDWGQRHRGKVDGHILIGSNLVQMVLRIVSLTVGMPLQLHSNQDSFLASIRSQIPKFRQLPTVDPQILARTASGVMRSTRDGGDRKGQLG